MSVDDIVQLGGLFALVILPSMAITARLAMRPMVEAILRLREGLQAEPAGTRRDAERAELARLREELEQLRTTVARLQDAEVFHRALLEAPARREEPAARAR